MITAGLALTSSALWGSADYLGGVLSRRRPAIEVVAVSQGIGLLAVWLLLLGTGTSIGRSDMLWGPLAGLAGGLALICFYSALAVGTMGVVAPIAALGLIIPVLAGLLGGDDPGAVTLTGMAIAFAGVVLASGPELSGGASARPILLAAVAGAGFGLTLLFLARGGEVLPTLAMMRVASVTLLGAVLLFLFATRGSRLPRVPGRELPALTFVGLADLGANGLYALAEDSGLLSVVAVLASLYPAVTVVLAWRLGGARLARIQVVGVVAALAGVVLVGAG
ncbi:EamA family transporter [soil metagenome]